MQTFYKLFLIPLTYTLFISFLTGCSVQDDYSAPQVNLPASWQRIINKQSQSSLELQDYWKQFKDPSLNKLMQKTYQDNLLLLEAGFRMQEALAVRGLQSAAYFPDIDLDISAERRRRSEAVASAISNPRNDFFSFGGVMQWEIDLFGRIKNLNEATSAQLESAIEDYRGVLVSVNAEVASAYVRYRILENQIRLTKNNIKRQKASFELTNSRFEAGLAPELDVRQAEANLEQTAAVLPQLKISLVRERNALAVLTGSYPDEIKNIFQEQQQIPEIKILNKLELPLNIFKQRPDLRQIERDMAAQYALIGAAKAEQYPILSLPGNFSFQSLNNFEEAFKGSSLAYAFGPNIQLNVLDFGRVDRNIDIQNFRLKQLHSRYRNQVLTAVQQVENALISMQQEKIRSESLSRSVTANIKSTDLAKSLYINGLTDFQNVLDSERNLFEQEINLAESRGNLFISYIALFRALGGGWSGEAGSIEVR